MRPPFAYFGGKTMRAPEIAAMLPAHVHYVEPFAGSLAVLLEKAPSKLETVNDLDGDLMTFWRVLRDRPVELERVCAMTPHSRAEHRAAYDLAVDDELERARRVWVLLTQGRTGTLRDTGWRFFTEGGTSAPMRQYLDAYAARIAPVAERLRRVSLECRPALEMIEQYGRHATTLLYLDPPYLGETRAGTPNGYRHEMRSSSEHAELLEAIVRCPAAVVLSGYASQLYDDALEGWSRVEIAAGTAQRDRWQERSEVLWSNRELGAVPTLFDAQR